MIEVPVRVKDALRDGRRLKNYIFKVLNDDNSVDFIIDNDTLVKESVKIDERMCTGNQLKFGLCEGSSLEFQYFDHPNITGRQIQAFIEVQFVDENGDLDWYEIPMGFFTVDQCPMQFSTGIRKVTAYNKLKSAYLDQNANLMLQELFPGVTQEYFFCIRDALLQEYEVDTYVVRKWGEWTPVLNQISNTLYGSPLYQPYFFTTTAYGHAGYPLYLASSKYEIDLDPNAFYRFEWIQGDVDTWEDYIYTDVIEWALRKDAMYDDISAINSAILSTNGTYLGCYTFMGVVLTDNNNQTSIYSKKAKDNNKYGAVGPISDITSGYLHGYKKITLYMPLFLGFSYVNGSGVRSVSIVTEPISGNIGIEINTDHALSYIGSKQNADGDHVWWLKNRPGRLLFDGSNAVGIYNDYHPYDLYHTTPTYVECLFSNGASTSDWIDGEKYVEGGAVPIDVNGLFVVKETPALNDADLIEVNPQDMPDITARDAISSVYELSACYGKLDRNSDYFAPVELNNSRLLPSDTLYPSDSLYPNGNSVRGNKSMYSKLWTDSQGVQTFRYLIITYKGLDENNQEVEKVLQRTVNADGTTDYNMSDNWLFKNLVWSDSDVGDYADAMVLKMQSVSWFPFEMWCAGLPYLETGDELEITTSEGTYTSYVLQRQLNGIQNLQDTFIDGELDIF